MSTSNSTPNYGLSQYLGGDIISILSNLNGDMTKIDTALKAILDNASAKTPLTRTIAGLPLSEDITLAQLIAVGLCAAPEGPLNWTPIIYGQTTAGNPTYASRHGQYVKVGNIVILYCGVNLSSLGGMSGYARMGGFPFAGAGFVKFTSTSGFLLPSGTCLTGSAIVGDSGNFEAESNTLITGVDTAALTDAFAFTGFGFLGIM